ncbi:MAG TPA: hypothetical protein PLP19_14995 [bacterium]|nr:hypothetical protein [bacterium]HPN44797.1 hypothetical protein [bacterium]
MKKVYLAISVLILSFSNLYSQKIGAVFIGANNYLYTYRNNHSHVKLTGVSAGWLIPINISSLPVYYKVKAAHHSVEDYDSFGFYGKLNYFFSATNEILVGKQFKVDDKISIIPQFGFGAMGEAVYRDWNIGYTYGGTFIDFSVITSYDCGKFSLGLMTNYEKGVMPDKDSMVSDQRLNIALLFIK